MVMAACSLCCLSTAVWLRLINDLITRLPLSLITASTGYRPEATSTTASESLNNSYLEIMSMCHKSCGVVFHLMVKNMHILRDEDDFTNMWSRFISILSTNAQSAYRGQWWHDDMTETLIALLQLLRLPEVPKNSEKFIPLSTNVSQHSPSPSLMSPIMKHATVTQLGDAHTAKTDAHTGSTNSYLGLFGWIVGPSITTPDVSVRGSHVDTTVVEHSVDDAQFQQPASHLVFETIHSMDGANEEHTQSGLDIQNHHDGRLLVIAWKTICSLHPVFAGHLKTKHLNLYNKLVSAMSYSEFLQFLAIQKSEKQTAVSASEANIRLDQMASSSIDPGSTDVKLVPLTALNISSPQAATHTNTTADVPHTNAAAGITTPPAAAFRAKTQRSNTKSISSSKAKPQIV